MLWGNHFAVYKYQISTLYTLNLCGIICQLYLKAGGEKITSAALKSQEYRGKKETS